MTAGLVACGGGGGGDTAATAPATPLAPQPVITGTLTASPTACVASVGAGDCVVTLNPTTTGAAAPVVVGQDGVSYPAMSSLPVTVSVGEPQTFELKNGATVLASASVSASCADGTTLDPVSKRCTKPVTTTQVYYERVNILITGEVIADSGNGTLAVGYPQILSGNTLTPVKNETGFQVGLCALTSMKLPDNGLPGAGCLEHEAQQRQRARALPDRSCA